MPSVTQTPQQLAAALAPLAAQIQGLQIYPGFLQNPSPPVIDMYPAEPFQEGAGFGIREKYTHWTVRARVQTSDMDAANQTLLRFLDPADPASVEAALAVGQLAVVDGQQGQVSGFRKYADDNGTDMIGCEWRVGVWTP